MKTLFISLFTLLTLAVNAQQKDINIAVKEISAADTAFNHHPGSMMIRFEGLNATYDTAILYFETTYQDNYDTTLYLAKETFTRGRVKMLLTAFKAAFNADGTINPTIANMILAPFKLMLR